MRCWASGRSDVALPFLALSEDLGDFVDFLAGGGFLAGAGAGGFDLGEMVSGGLPACG